MYRHAVTLLALLALLPWPARAQEGPQQKGILAKAIRLVEEPEEKRGPFTLPFGTIPQDVDINSTVRVRISTDDLLAGLTGAPVANSSNPEAAALRKSAGELRKAGDFLQRAIADATELAQLALAGKRNSPEFEQIALRDQAALNQVFEIVKAHLAALRDASRPELRAHAAEALQRSDAAVLEGRLAYAAFLVEEIRWTLERLEATRASLEKDSPSVALILSVSLVRADGTSEVGLPHYNDLPLGVPKSVDKLNLGLTPEQIALQQDAAALAQVLNQAIQGSAELRAAVRQLLAAKGLDIQKLDDALDRVKEDASALRETDWSEVGDLLEARLRAALDAATAEQRKLLQDTLIPEAEALQARARDLRSTLIGLLDSVGTLQASLAETSNQDPAMRLVALLAIAQAGSDLVSGDLFQDLRSEIELWSKAVTSLQSQVEEVRTQAKGLPKKLRDEIAEVLSDAAADKLGALRTHLAQLQSAAEQVATELQRFASDLKGAPALAVALDQAPPDTSFRVAFKDIKDTWIDVRTLNPRAEDDVVVLRAWLFRMKPDANDPQKLVEAEELDSDLQQLRLLRFGWYSAAGVGVVYMSSWNDLGAAGWRGEADPGVRAASFVAGAASGLAGSGPGRGQSAGLPLPTALVELGGFGPPHPVARPGQRQPAGVGARREPQPLQRLPADWRRLGPGTRRRALPVSWDSPVGPGEKPGGEQQARGTVRVGYDARDERRRMIYKFPLALAPQPEGGFTVTSPVLPELVTEGDTIDEALAHVQDALAAVLEAYQDLGRSLPASVQVPETGSPVWLETLVSLRDS